MTQKLRTLVRHSRTKAQFPTPPANAHNHLYLQLPGFWSLLLTSVGTCTRGHIPKGRHTQTCIHIIKNKDKCFFLSQLFSVCNIIFLSDCVYDLGELSVAAVWAFSYFWTFSTQDTKEDSVIPGLCSLTFRTPSHYTQKYRVRSGGHCCEPFLFSGRVETRQQSREGSSFMSTLSWMSQPWLVQ